MVALHCCVSISLVQQRESAIHTHISPLLWISFPFRSPKSTEQSSPCQLSILRVVVYMSAPISQLTHSCLPPGYPYLYSLCLFLLQSPLFLSQEVKTHWMIMTTQMRLEEHRNLVKGPPVDLSVMDDFHVLSINSPWTDACY